MTKEINEEVRKEFYDLILKAACGNKKRADALRDKLDKANIKCIADFDCTRLLNIMRIKGIGKVYGKILYEMFQLRLEQTIGKRKTVVRVEDVMDIKEEPA